MKEILGAGAADNEIYEYAAKYNIPIITHDRGFGILYHFSESIKPSIVHPHL